MVVSPLRYYLRIRGTLRESALDVPEALGSFTRSLTRISSPYQPAHGKPRLGSALPPGEADDAGWYWYIHGVVELVVLGLGRGRHGGQASEDGYGESVMQSGAGILGSECIIHPPALDKIAHVRWAVVIRGGVLDRRPACS